MSTVENITPEVAPAHWAVDPANKHRRVRRQDVRERDDRPRSLRAVQGLVRRHAGRNVDPLTIDAGSLDTGHAKRDEHLRSADFFKGQTIPGCDSTPRGWTTSARACCACTGQLEAAGTSVPLEFGCPGHRAG